MNASQEIDITHLLNAAKTGEPHKVSQLLDVTYDHLRRMAYGKIADEEDKHLLQPTELVSEAYLRLFEKRKKNHAKSEHWQHRGHFFAAAAEAMRRVLIDSARKRLSLKRGGRVDYTTLDESKIEGIAPDEEVLAVDEALNDLEQEGPELVQVVKLRYFAGMTVSETAAALGVSTRTVNRQWECARVWLLRRISKGE